MKYVYIIRHGETDNNKVHRFQGRGIDASINAKGLAQAEEVASVLQEKPITKVVTSSLVRTLETAQPLIDQINPVVESYRDLDEMGFGDYEGSYIHEIKEEIDQLQQRWEAGDIDHSIKGGESPKHVFDRAGKKMQEVLRESDDEHIAFFLHGRLIRILLSVFVGKGLVHMQEIEHCNGSINYLTWENDEFGVIELDHRAHLSEVTV